MVMFTRDINRFFMKLSKTSDMDIVKYCQQCFYFDMPSDLWEKRVRTFEGKFSKFCQCIGLVKFLFVHLSMYLFRCLFIRFF